jgi:hypothetical protein
MRIDAVREHGRRSLMVVCMSRRICVELYKEIVATPAALAR